MEKIVQIELNTEEPEGDSTIQQEERELNIILYSIRPDQEYAKSLQNGHAEGGWDNTWDNGTSYYETLYDNHLNGNNRLRNIKIDKATVLGDLIAVRKDSEEFGFVHNKLNEAVFYADKRAINEINTLIRREISAVKEEKPELLKKLLIT